MSSKQDNTGVLFVSIAGDEWQPLFLEYQHSNLLNLFLPSSGPEALRQKAIAQVRTFLTGRQATISGEEYRSQVCGVEHCQVVTFDFDLPKGSRLKPKRLKQLRKACNVKFYGEARATIHEHFGLEGQHYFTEASLLTMSGGTPQITDQAQEDSNTTFHQEGQVVRFTIKPQERDEQYGKPSYDPARDAVLAANALGLFITGSIPPAHSRVIIRDRATAM